jgi:hypothetical protein
LGDQEYVPGGHLPKDYNLVILKKLVVVVQIDCPTPFGIGRKEN